MERWWNSAWEGAFSNIQVNHNTTIIMKDFQLNDILDQTMIVMQWPSYRFAFIFSKLLLTKLIATFKFVKFDLKINFNSQHKLYFNNGIVNIQKVFSPSKNSMTLTSGKWTEECDSKWNPLSNRSLMFITGSITGGYWKLITIEPQSGIQYLSENQKLVIRNSNL